MHTGPPRESNATPTLTDQTDEASNGEVHWDHPEETDDNEVVRNSEANVNNDRRGCPVEEITDWTDDIDNGLSWNQLSRIKNSDSSTTSTVFSTGNAPKNIVTIELRPRVSERLNIRRNIPNK